MGKIIHYPYEGGIREIEIVSDKDISEFMKLYAPKTEKISPVELSEIKKNGIAEIKNIRKKSSQLEKFAKQTIEFIDVAVRGKVRGYLKTNNVRLMEDYLSAYIEEFHEIKEIKTEEEEEHSEPYERLLRENEPQAYDEQKEVDRIFLEYLKEQKRDPVMEYLRENLYYNVANEIMSFVVNPEKKLDARNKPERLPMLKLLHFKGKLKEILEE